MIRSDYHVHSDYSIDSCETMEESICSAIKCGLKEIVFTDHYETLNKHESLENVIDYEKYIADIDALRSKYAHCISIKLGSEINLEPDFMVSINNCIDRYPFDFILGSLHAVNYVDVGMPEYYKGLSVDQYHEKYFEDLIEALDHDFHFSVLGHLDYITRYGGYASNTVDLKKQGPYIEEILKKLIASGKGIELNTSGMRYRLNRFHPSEEILRLYHKLGGEIITVGSDSHVADTIAKDFGIAESLLMSIGFRYYTVYDGMSPKFVKLGE